MQRPSLLIVLPILGYIWLAAGVTIAAAYYPGYSHTVQFMSELGARGTGNGFLVNLLVFAAAEIWIFLFLLVAIRLVPLDHGLGLGLALIGVYAALLVIAAVSPCDFECRPSGPPSNTHLVHVGAGLAAYVAGLAGLWFLCSGLRKRAVWPLPDVAIVLFLSTGIILLCGVVSSETHAGLFQRALETLLFGWMAVAGYGLSRVAKLRP